jgi:hypothetical protein
MFEYAAAWHLQPGKGGVDDDAARAKERREAAPPADCPRAHAANAFMPSAATPICRQGPPSPGAAAHIDVEMSNIYSDVPRHAAMLMPPSFSFIDMMATFPRRSAAIA